MHPFLIKDPLITSEMLNLIAEIDEFKGAWLHLGRLRAERLQALRKVATIESIGSSTRIEGAQLSDAQVEQLLGQMDGGTFHTRDEQEVAGYADLCEQIYRHYNDMSLTENIVKQLHSELLRLVEREDWHRGKYKNTPVRIEAFDAKGQSLGVVFETTSPLETPFKMKDLLEWINEAFSDKQWHPLIIIGLFVCLFLAIHPFQDGNGRLSRLLTTLLLLKQGYRYVPYTSLESVIEVNKTEYYRALQKSQTSWQRGDSDWSPWLLFFLRCLQRQKQHLQVKLEKELLLDTTISLLGRQILELLNAHGNLKMSDLMRLTKANRNTLKKTLAALVKNGHVRLHGTGKGSYYGLN